MIIILVVLLLVVLAIVVTLAIVFTRDKDSKPDIPTSKPILPPPTAPPGADGPYKHAVVASDAGPCSELGRDILKRGGTAVDSAVASLFCIGVYNMHSAGVGGGGFMVVYKKETRSVEVIDFREEAPGKANRTMYVGGKLKSRIGGAAAGVPGEVKGFYEAWKKYGGKIPWKDLVQPSIDMARDGFPFGFSAYYAATRSSVQPLLKADPGFRQLLFNKDGELKKLGEILYMPKFARTLERIRDNPEDFYFGELAKDVVQDVKDGGGIFTLNDLKNYKVKFKKPMKGVFGEYSWYSTPPPGSGVVLSFILNILKGYNMKPGDRNGIKNSTLTYHRIVEAFNFGARYRSTRTGIIYNNEMDDFSTPGKKNAYGVEPSESNMIVPGKRPQSSTAPSLFLDKNGTARLAIGASGGTKITTAISLVMMNYLWFNRTLPQAVVDPRLHHQLMPMYIRIDKDFQMPLAIQEGLQKLGHEVRNISGYAVVQAAATNDDGTLTGKSDPRKSGWAAGY
ncbi:Gamma-glutamyltranspeptidase 1 [Stylophora pistillata]|uniref:Gamma-glutamyltranspeptidase 1 n=1 Tax=Stylophora pistillata TaxID=50429 RepID=A0A2B4S1U8_STYPI|nr:Gamma-glutamyltranspeptidase 1 [Stylophora pistillata]